MKMMIASGVVALAAAASAQTVVYQQPAYPVATPPQIIQQPVVTPQPVYVEQPVVVQQPVYVQQPNVLPNGTVMPVGAKVCSKCGGTGVHEGFWKDKRCSHCKGYGYRMPSPPPPPVVAPPPPKHHKHHHKH